MRDSSSTVRTTSSLLRLHHLVDRDHAIPLARGLVDRFEDGGGQHRLVLALHQRFQRADRGLVHRIGRQDLAVGLDRASQILQVLAPQLADAVAQRNHLGGRRRQLGLPLEHGEQVVPASQLLIQTIERLRGVVVLGIEVHDRAVGLDRAFRIAELAVVDLPEHEQHLLLLDRRGRQLRLLGVDVLEVVPASEADVEALQLIEGGLVAVVDGQHVLEDAHGALQILDHLFVELRGAEVERLLLGDVVDDLRLAQQQLDEVVIVRAPQIQLLERVRRLEIARPHVQRRQVGVRRLHVVAQVRLGQARDLVIERVLPLRIGDRRNQSPIAGDQIVQPAQRAGQAFDARLHLRVLRVLGQRARQRLVGVRRDRPGRSRSPRRSACRARSSPRDRRCGAPRPRTRRSAAASRRGSCRSARAAARRRPRAPALGRIRSSAAMVAACSGSICRIFE